MIKYYHFFFFASMIHFITISTINDIASYVFLETMAWVYLPILGAINYGIGKGWIEEIRGAK